MSSFLPLCHHCHFSIDDKQGFLLSCGHFVCLGCCQGTQPSACPHCGAHARAAPLENPPAEVREYLQNPLTQLKAANDVVMFQLDHFRAAASQANKALQELRLMHSQEISRREAAEDDAQAWRRRAEAAESANARSEHGRRDVAHTVGRDESSLGPALGGRRGGALSTADREIGDPAGGEDSRQSFDGGTEGRRRPAAAAGTSTSASTAYSSHHFKRPSEGRGDDSGGGDGGGVGGPRDSSQEQRMPAGRGSIAPTLNGLRSPSPVDRSTQPRPRQQAGVTRGQQQQQQFRLSLSAGAGENGRTPSDSFSPPIPPARPLRLGSDRLSRTLDAPRLAVSVSAPGHGSAPPNTTSAGKSQGAYRQQQQQQQRRHVGERETPGSTTETQRPGTPGRPVLPSWQNGNSNDVGGKVPASPTGASSAGGADMAARRERQASLHLTQHQHQHQQGRSQRPTTSQHGSTAGEGGGEFSTPSPTPTPPPNVQGGRGTSPGSSRPLPARPGSGQVAVTATSPSSRSPLLAVRPRAPKRPSSGSLPTPKRPGLLGAGAGGAHKRRAGTPVPIPRAISPSPPIRSAHLPFTPRSTQRPGSGQRPRSNGGNGGRGGAGRFGDGYGRPASSVPPSLEAAGLFGRRAHVSGGAR